MQKASIHTRLNHYGFSLIEVLVAMAIFSIAILGMTSMMITAVKLVTFSRNRTTAVTLARDKMENLKRQADAAPLTSTNNDQEDDIDANGVEAAGSFDRAWTITGTSGNPVMPGAGEGILIAINVTITWTDFSSHTLTQTTLISQ